MIEQTLFGIPPMYLARDDRSTIYLFFTLLLIGYFKLANTTFAEYLLATEAAKKYYLPYLAEDKTAAAAAKDLAPLNKLYIAGNIYQHFMCQLPLDKNKEPTIVKVK